MYRGDRAQSEVKGQRGKTNRYDRRHDIYVIRKTEGIGEKRYIGDNVGIGYKGYSMDAGDRRYKVRKGSRMYKEDTRWTLGTEHGGDIGTEVQKVQYRHWGQNKKGTWG